MKDPCKCPEMPNMIATIDLPLRPPKNTDRWAVHQHDARPFKNVLWQMVNFTWVVDIKIFRATSGLIHPQFGDGRVRHWHARVPASLPSFAGPPSCCAPTHLPPLMTVSVRSLLLHPTVTCLTGSHGPLSRFPSPMGWGRGPGSGTQSWLFCPLILVLILRNCVWVSLPVPLVTLSRFLLSNLNSPTHSLRVTARRTLGLCHTGGCHPS